jgi:hypothetical protein
MFHHILLYGKHLFLINLNVEFGYGYLEKKRETCVLAKKKKRDSHNHTIKGRNAMIEEPP